VLSVRHMSFVVRGLVFVAVLLLSSTALAEGVIVVAQPRSLARVDRQGTPVEKRPRDRKPEGISHRDCVDDQRVRFSLELTGFVGEAGLDVWAGPALVDCAAEEARSGREPTCRRLLDRVAVEPELVLDVPVRALVSVAAGRAPTAERDVCDGVDLTTVGVHFFTSTQSSESPAARAKVTIEIDTVGPPPPRGLDTRPANGRLALSWENVDAPGGISAVRAYCEPAVRLPAWRPPPDGGTTRVCRRVPTTVLVDGGADGVSIDGGESFSDEVCMEVPNGPGPEIPAIECASTSLMGDGGAEIVPTAALDEGFLCGETFANFANGMRAGALGGAPLENDVSYAVAVAATDLFGNVGPLSGVVCEMPESTNDFWERYQAAGGGAGGGYCSTSAPGLAGSVSLASLAMVGLGLMIRRRRGTR
jgi:hypothetical protein